MEQTIRLDALSVALQHTAVAADQQNICRLLQVCKSWRQTVQQTAASMTEVTFLIRYIANIDKCLERTAGFGRWLCKYAGMAHSITISASDARIPYEHQELFEAMRSLVERSMQAAAQAAATPGTPAMPATDIQAVAASDVVTTPQPLLLQEFRSLNVVAGPAILSALPGAFLTSLTMTTPRMFSKPMAQAFTTALQQLSSLRKIAFVKDPSRYDVTADYLVSLEPLTGLTSLRLDQLGACGARHLKMLPQGLRALDLRCVWAGPEREVQINLAHLSNLQQLSVYGALGCQLAAGSHLPEQLEDLQLFLNSFSLSSLGAVIVTQLQRLVISTDISAADLMRLTKLPKLQHVSLRYGDQDIETVLQAAAVWPQLQIQELVLRDPVMSVGEANALFRALSPLTLLNRLVINVYIEKNEEGDQDDVIANADVISNERTVYLFQSFKNLKHLEDLWCKVVLDGGSNNLGVVLAHGDLLHLSSLTGLTQLYLDCNWSLHQDELVAILSHLKQLRNLHLWYEGSHQSSTLEAIDPVVRLTNLTGFNCFGGSQPPHGT